MLKKLLVWATVVGVAGLLALPALAQTTSDLSVPWGSDQWLINQFGVNGNMTKFCNTITQDPSKEAGWLQQFPNLADLCHISQPQGASQQPSQGGSQPPPPQGTSQPQPQGSPQPQMTPSQTQTTNH